SERTSPPAFRSPRLREAPVVRKNELLFDSSHRTAIRGPQGNHFARRGKTLKVLYYVKLQCYFRHLPMRSSAPPHQGFALSRRLTELARVAGTAVYAMMVCSPLLLARRPRTPLRVFCIAAFEFLS